MNHAGFYAIGCFQITRHFHQRELFSGDNFLKIDSDAIPNSASARAHKADCHKPSVRHPGDHGGSGVLVKRQAMFLFKGP
jgi:hypothetical protein